MKQKFRDAPICEKGHDKTIEMYCTKCEMWICNKCKEKHLDHEGLLKDFEELTNQNVQVYVEHMKDLRMFFEMLEKAPADRDYDEVKQELDLKINAAYDQLVSQLYKHRDGHLKRINDYIEHAKRKRQRMEQEAKAFEISLGKLQNILNKLKKHNVHKIPKQHLFKYNNFSRVKFHEESIEKVKKAIERCGRVYEKFIRLRGLEIKAQLKDSYINKMIQIPSNLKEEPRLTLIQPDSANMIVLNLETMRKRLVILGEKGFRFPQHFEFVDTKHKIFLCGGNSNLDKFLANTYEISVDSGGIKELPRMEVAKKYHSLCMPTSTLICSTGGLGSSGALRTCEAYDTLANEWTMMSPLNEPREGPSTCAVAEKYIYCIGGRADKTTLFSTMEVMDLSFAKMGWQLTSLQSETCQPMYFGLACTLSTKQLLICGGLGAGEAALSRAYILDLEKNELKECEPMRIPDCFLERDRKLYKGHLYAIGYSSYAVHIFDTEKRQWAVIKSQSPQGQTEEAKSSVVGA